MRNHLKSKRALVLGGGGAAGNAWLIGVIAGLFDGGLDVTEADLIIGTSAGSTTAAQITGAAPGKLLTDILEAVFEPPIEPARAGQQTVPSKPPANHMETTGAIISAAHDARDMRRRMGEWALGKDATLLPSAHAQWRATVAARLPNKQWPQQAMLITAVDANTGEPHVFDRHSGIDLVDAVAASCAGGFAYSFGGTRFIDGGYRADVNADLAGGYERVLIIPPLGDKTRKQLAWGLHLSAQADELRAQGSRVEIIVPDSEAQNALGVGMNLMDLSTRRLSAQAGYKQGKAIAGQLTKFWR